MSKQYDYIGNGLSGIVNTGNTCYLNSCIQCISNTLLLTKFFLEEKDNYFETLDLEKNECKLVKEWYRLLDGMWEDNCIVAPNSLKKIILQLFSKKIGISTLNQQNDMSEFMVFILDCLHEGLSRKVTIKPKLEGKKKIYKDAVKYWIDSHKNSYSEIIDIFYGQLVSYIKDVKNEKILSFSFQPSCYLMLEINKEKDDTTLYDCLDVHFGNEIMDEENKYNYKDELVVANKSIEYWHLPKILIIVLKRFNNLNQKINKNILFPFNLDMSKYSRIKENALYELYAVGNHLGCADGGHYNAYCKNSNNLWYVFDDHDVKKINRRNVISSSAYCLFYSKKK